MEDTAIKAKFKLYSDNSPARQFAMRHIMTRHLLLQNRVRLGHLQLMAVLGTENPADLMTKALTRTEIVKYLIKMGASALG
jgi:hypothetical protein